MKYKTIKEFKKINEIADKLWEMAGGEDFFIHKTGCYQEPTKTTMSFLHKIPKSFRTQVARRVEDKSNYYRTLHSGQSQRTWDLGTIEIWLKKQGDEMKPSNFKVKDKVRYIPRQANGKYVWKAYNPYNLQSQDFKCKDGVVVSIDTKRGDEEIGVRHHGYFVYWYHAEELVLRKTGSK